MIFAILGGDMFNWLMKLIPALCVICFYCGIAFAGYGDYAESRDAYDTALHIEIALILVIGVISGYPIYRIWIWWQTNKHKPKELSSEEVAEGCQNHS